MRNVKSTEVVIIGGGPAGLTAALYLGRAQIETLLIDKDMCGGQVISSPLLENVPGYYGSGAELAIQMLNEVEKYPSVEIMNFTKVIKVTPETDGAMCNDIGWNVELEDGTLIICKYIICATGSTPIHLQGIEGPNVHYCVTCDGALYKDRVAAIIGGGNSALQYALELANYARKVYVVTNEPELRGEVVMRDKVIYHPNIEVVYNFTANAFNGAWLESADGKLIRVDGVFVAVGYRTNTNYLSCDKNNGRFYTDNFFRIFNGNFYYSNALAVGDCRFKPHNQVVIAMSEGCQAALEVIDELSLEN